MIRRKQYSYSFDGEGVEFMLLGLKKYKVRIKDQNCSHIQNFWFNKVRKHQKAGEFIPSPSSSTFPTICRRNCLTSNYTLMGYNGEGIGKASLQAAVIY
jgi:hypothetical protein